MRLHLSAETAGLILADLSDICKLADGNKAVIQSACTAAANLIAGSGQYGGSEQTHLMRAAENAGFTPEFYGNGVRVSFFGEDRKSATWGKGQKKSAS